MVGAECDVKNSESYSTQDHGEALQDGSLQERAELRLHGQPVHGLSAWLRLLLRQLHAPLLRPLAGSMG